MNFTAQLPNVTVGFRTTTGFSKSNGELQCCQCDGLTAWYHHADLLYFCSDECYRQFHLDAERRFQLRTEASQLTPSPEPA